MKKVLILFGGNSYEHEISCKSVKNIITNIDRKKFCYKTVGINYENEWFEFDDDLSYLENGNWLKAKISKIIDIQSYLKKFDIVFPLIHGNDGEDGKWLSILELASVKYIGSNTLTSACLMDKATSKILFDGLNIRQVPYMIIKGDYKIKDIINEIGFPMVVKPSSCGSSIGVNKVTKKKELINAIKEALRYDDKIIIEKYVVARELECAIVENKSLICSSIGEINYSSNIYDYNSKYFKNNTYTTIPDDLDKEVINKIKRLSIKTFKKIGCRSFAIISFFYDEKNRKIYLNEINTIPKFTDNSMFVKLMLNENISYSELISMLINNAFV